MRSRLLRRSFLGLAGLVVVATACAPTPAAQPTAAPPAAKPAAAAPAGAKPTAAPAAKPAAAKPTSAPAAPAAAAKPAEGQKEFKVGFGSSPGFSHVGMLTAIEELNKRGYKIEPVFFAQGELGVQAAAKGDVAISNGTTSATLDAIQKGAPLKLISERNFNEWTIYSKATVQQCADLNGKKLAVHSSGAVSTRMVNDWLKENCPQAKPDTVIIAGSDNRAAALKAGQIDATPLELSDGITLDQTAPGNFRRLVDFGKALPKLSTSSNFANSEFLAKNPGVVRDLVREQLQAHRKFAEDPQFLQQQTIKFIPNINKDTLDEVAKAYVDLHGFPLNGGFDRETLAFTIKFFEDAGTIKPGLKPEEVADLSVIQDVLKEIGTRQGSR